MHTYVKLLQEISGRYAPSRILSFDMAHVLKAFQLMEDNDHISRELLCHELNLGEGSIKTLIKHLKMHNMVETSNVGTVMSSKGKKIFNHLQSCIPTECVVPYCSIAIGRYNYAVLVKNLRYVVRSGLEQRDAAIKIGALGATTLFYINKKIIIAGSTYDALRTEPSIRQLLLDNLKPEEMDVIIIGSDELDPRIAEHAAKTAALVTLMDHEKHGKYEF